MYKIVTFTPQELFDKAWETPVLKLAQEIGISDTLLAPHPLVIKWLKCVKAAKTHEGHLVTTGKHVLDARISSELIDRCALIFDTLIKESEVLGYTWKVTSDEKTLVEVDGEPLAIKLVERLNKHAIPPPPPPPRRNARWEPDFSLLRASQFEWSSTGELSLQIDARTEYGKRKNWTDTKTGKIEEKLTSIFDGFEAIAESVKALRLKNEEARRERIAEEAVRLELAKREETHRRLRHKLVENTKRWEQAQRLRAFIQATCNASAATSEHSQQQTALWAAWASTQANLLDPLHPNTSSVTSLTVDIESWFNGYGMTRAEKDWWSE